jgi:hypothetical protein
MFTICNLKLMEARPAYIESANSVLSLLALLKNLGLLNHFLEYLFRSRSCVTEPGKSLIDFAVNSKQFKMSAAHLCFLGIQVQVAVANLDLGMITELDWCEDLYPNETLYKVCSDRLLRSYEVIANTEDRPELLDSLKDYYCRTRPLFRNLPFLMAQKSVAHLDFCKAHSTVLKSIRGKEGCDLGVPINIVEEASTLPRDIADSLLKEMISEKHAALCESYDLEGLSFKYHKEKYLKEQEDRKMDYDDDDADVIEVID